MNEQPDNRPEEIQDRPVSRDELRRTLADAREALDREVYRLDTIGIYLDQVREEIGQLESVSLTGLMSSLFGTKAGKLDACQERSQNLEREQRECAQEIETLREQVERLTEQLGGLADAAVKTRPNPDGKPGGGPDRRYPIEQAIDAGESLVNHLGGMYGLCNRLRHPTSMPRCGAILNAARDVWGNRVAGGVNRQIADSVRRFCDKRGQLQLDPENPSDAEVLAARAQVERFADPASLGAAAEAEAWAELEAVASGLISDLRERLSRAASRGD